MDVKILCLGALLKGEASGYEIRKQFEEGAFAHFQAASFGSIYPALRALQEDGLVTVTSQAQEARPDKKLYRLTERGRARLLEALRTDPQPDRIRSDFTFILYFAQLVPPDQLGRVIDARIRFYEDLVSRLEGACTSDAGSPATPGERFVIEFGLNLYRTAARFLSERKGDLLTDLATSAPPRSISSPSEVAS